MTITTGGGLPPLSLIRSLILAIISTPPLNQLAGCTRRKKHLLAVFPQEEGREGEILSFFSLVYPVAVVRPSGLLILSPPARPVSSWLSLGNQLTQRTEHHHQ